jgi:hypothetical protein
MRGIAKSTNSPTGLPHLSATTDETADMTHKAKRESAEGSLRGVVYALDAWDGKEPKEFVKSLRKHVVDVIALLEQPNSQIKHIGFIVLAFQQSTSVKVSTVNGKRITRVAITDKTMYEWALEEVHKLAGLAP